MVAISQNTGKGVLLRIQSHVLHKGLQVAQENALGDTENNRMKRTISFLH